VLAEVWPGRVVDVLSQTIEVLGMSSVVLAFLDESGSSFVQDYSQLEQLAPLSPDVRAIADNCVRPGAPVFVWHSLGSTSYMSSPWALPEFLEAQQGVEDWMIVLGHRTPRGDIPLVSSHI